MNSLTEKQKELLVAIAPIFAKSCAPLLEMVIQKRAELFMQFIFGNLEETKEQKIKRLELELKELKEQE